MSKTVALPTIPAATSQELYQYFIKLHQNIQILEQRIAVLEAQQGK